MTILSVGNNIDSNKTAMPLSCHKYGNVFKFAKFILLLYGFKKMHLVCLFNELNSKRMF